MKWKQGVQVDRMVRGIPRSTAAIMLLGALLIAPSAWAQKGKGKGKPKPAPAPAQPAGGELDLDKPAPAPAAPAAPAGEMDLDKPAGAPATPGAETPAPVVGGGGGGGICEIDPTACPKESDIKAAAGREVSAEVYAVQQIYALRRHRLEVNPYWAATLNDQFVSHPAPGLGLNYYISNVLAIGVNGQVYQPFNVDSEFNFINRRATRVSVPLTEYQWNANLNFTYVPMYGKFAGFQNFIFHFDAYVVGGLGVLSTRPIPVIDPDNRKFPWKPKLAFNAGLGLRIFFNRWFAAMLEVRDYIYNEKLENLSIAVNPANDTYWYGDNRLTNNVQAQLGVSIFFPFSWEYRLPK